MEVALARGAVAGERSSHAPLALEQRREAEAAGDRQHRAEVADHPDDALLELAEVEGAVAALREAALAAEQLAQQLGQVKLPPGEDAQVAVHRQQVVAGLEGRDDAGRDRLLADAGEPLGEPALAHQDQHLLLYHPGEQQRAVELAQLLGSQARDQGVGQSRGVFHLDSFSTVGSTQANGPGWRASTKRRRFDDGTRRCFGTRSPRWPTAEARRCGTRRRVRLVPPRGDPRHAPAEILAHVGDLFDWALCMARGEPVWRNSPPRPWPQRSRASTTGWPRLDAQLAAHAPLATSAELLFQGPVADALTHVGQITLLRRMAGSPVRGESYRTSRDHGGRRGPEQAPPRREFE